MRNDTDVMLNLEPVECTREMILQLERENNPQVD